MLMTNQNFEYSAATLALDTKIISLLNKQPMTISELLYACDGADSRLFHKRLIYLLENSLIHSVSANSWQEMTNQGERTKMWCTSLNQN